MSALLSVSNLSRYFEVNRRIVKALDGVSFNVEKGECLAIVGESGSGKSTIANIILGIYGPTAGDVTFKCEALPVRRTQEHRRSIQLVQQNPLSSLNPRRSIGASLRLALDVHNIGKKAGRTARTGELLEEVGLPAELSSRSPSALSGGQCQRVAIARALACQSELVVLDEPTSALDVLVQARVLKLLKELKESRGLTYVFITHDLSVVRNIADRVAVFEKGRLVELATTDAIFSRPESRYTRRLIGAVPVASSGEAALRDHIMEQVNGNA